MLDYLGEFLEDVSLNSLDLDSVVNDLGLDMGLFLKEVMDVVDGSGSDLDFFNGKQVLSSYILDIYEQGMASQSFVLWVAINSSVVWKIGVHTLSSIVDYGGGDIEFVFESVDDYSLGSISYDDYIKVLKKYDSHREQVQLEQFKLLEANRKLLAKIKSDSDKALQLLLDSLDNKQLEVVNYLRRLDKGIKHLDIETYRLLKDKYCDFDDLEFVSISEYGLDMSLKFVFPKRVRSTSVSLRILLDDYGRIYLDRLPKAVYKDIDYNFKDYCTKFIECLLVGNLVGIQSLDDYKEVRRLEIAKSKRELSDVVSEMFRHLNDF